MATSRIVILNSCRLTAKRAQQQLRVRCFLEGLNEGGVLRWADEKREGRAVCPRSEEPAAGLPPHRPAPSQRRGLGPGPRDVGRGGGGARPAHFEAGGLGGADRPRLCVGAGPAPAPGGKTRGAHGLDGAARAPRGHHAHARGVLRGRQQHRVHQRLHAPQLRHAIPPGRRAVPRRAGVPHVGRVSRRAVPGLRRGRHQFLDLYRTPKGRP